MKCCEYGPVACIIKRITALIYGFRNKLEHLSLNTKLGWKVLPGINTLAYYGNSRISSYVEFILICKLDLFRAQTKKYINKIVKISKRVTSRITLKIFKIPTNPRKWKTYFGVYYKHWKVYTLAKWILRIGIHVVKTSLSFHIDFQETLRFDPASFADTSDFIKRADNALRTV